MKVVKTKKMSEKLLPCPFCGNHPAISDEKWNRRNLDHLYIHHPVTGERMDKSMCKRVITQMYDEKRATKVKRHSTKHAIYEHCGSCNAPLSSTYSFCPNCGKKIDWSK